MNILKKFKSFFDGTWRDDEYLEKFNEDAKQWYAYIQIQNDVKNKEVDYVDVITMNGRGMKFPTLVKGLKYIYEHVSEIPEAELKPSYFHDNGIAFVPTDMPFVMEIVFKRNRIN